MAVTRLERKGKRNKNVAKNRVSTIKRLKTVPPMPKVDVEAIKAEFRGEKPAEATSSQEEE